MTTYYFIRHAEKEYDGTRNPHLTLQGKKRARQWAEVLKNKGIEAVYCTHYQRTQETAQPLLDLLQIDYNLYNPRELYCPQFQLETKAKTVLIVGHQDTTPAFINRVLGEEKYTFINSHNFENLYRVAIDDRGKIESKLMFSKL